MSFVFKNILWLDCVGAILTGVLLLTLCGWIAPLYGLPVWMVLGHALVHMTYGTYSFSLAVRDIRPMRQVKLLVYANGLWAVICLVLAILFIVNTTVLAATHFFVEGVYVGCLAFIEWKWRETLVSG